MPGQPPLNFVGKVNDHHFTGGLIVYSQDFMASLLHLGSDLSVRTILVENSGVVKGQNNFFVDNFFFFES